MKTASRITLTLAVLSLLAAIWIGPWWAWLLTALILLFVGAGLSGSNLPTTYAEGGEVGPVHLRDGEILSSTGDPELDEAINTRPNYGRKADGK